MALSLCAYSTIQEQFGFYPVGFRKPQSLDFSKRNDFPGKPRIILAIAGDLQDIPNAPILMITPPEPELTMETLTIQPKTKNKTQPKYLYKTDPSANRVPAKIKDISMPWDDMDRTSLLLAIENHLVLLKKQSSDKIVQLGDRKVSIGKLEETLVEFQTLLNKDLPQKKFSQQVEKQYEFISVGQDKDKRMLFTGYYTPVIEASRNHAPGYEYPIYQKPENLARTRYIYQQRYSGDPYARLFFTDGPNYTRKDIDELHLLDDRQLEIAWLRDDMERYFLHIQGSGILRFPNGDLQGVQYTGSNGYAYESVGRKLLREGIISISEGSMQGIKRHFREHPDDISKYVYENKRYIFFKPSDGIPRGASGAAVVGGRSIAVDPKYFPYGALGFMKAKKPILGDEGEVKRWEKMSRFVVAQDTGAAIRGPGHVDLYFGIGKRAGASAGRYMQKGKLFFLLKK